MKKIWQKWRYKIMIAALPLVLVLSYSSEGGNITFWERMRCLLEVIFKSAPFMIVYLFFVDWYGSNQVFAVSIGTALLVNMLVGARCHWKDGTFSIKEMLKKEIEMMMVVSFAYISLKVLTAPLNESFAGYMFKTSIEFVSILYPVSKTLKNIFIITNGKHPPAFIMKALYNYEKEGKLKDFFDSVTGGESSQKSEVSSEEAGVSHTGEIESNEERVENNN